MISIELWRARIGNWGSRKVRNSNPTPTQLVDTFGISITLITCVIFMLLVIGGIELNPGPRDQDKEVRSEFSINVPDDFEFVGPSEAPVQFIASTSMCERVKAPKKYHFGKKGRKYFIVLRLVIYPHLLPPIVKLVVIQKSSRI